MIRIQESSVQSIDNVADDPQFDSWAGDDVTEVMASRLIIKLRYNNPDDFVQEPDLSEIYVYSIPSKRHGVDLRRGHAFGLRGFIILEFNEFKSFFFRNNPSDLTHVAKEGIIGFDGRIIDGYFSGEDRGYGYDELVAEIISEADSVKTIDLAGNEINSNVRPFKEFIDEYINKANLDVGASYWEKVHEAFHSQFENYLAPSSLFRGLSYSGDDLDRLLTKLEVPTEYVKSGMRYTYQHFHDHPISTSRSRRVADDFAEDNSWTGFAVTIKFLSVDSNNVVIDMGKADSAHPAQAEVILRPDRDYVVEIVNVYNQ